MFPNALSTYEVKRMEQRSLVASAAARGRFARDVAGDRRPRSGGGPRRIFAAAFARLGTLAPNSHDGLRSKEQELAACGVSWTADPAVDEVLARQIESARRRRRNGPCAADDVAAASADHLVLQMSSTAATSARVVAAPATNPASARLAVA